MSKSESGNKAQKLNPSSTNLLTILRHKGDASTHILQEMAESLSMDKVGNLMTVIVTASKDCPAHRADVAKILLWRAPPVWVHHVEVRQLCGAMILTPTSLWKNWIDTSKVEKLMVGVDDYSLKASVVTDEWLSLIGSGKFSQLIALDLTGCINITDASVVVLAHKCSQLTSLDLHGCSNITNASVIQLTHKDT